MGRLLRPSGTTRSLNERLMKENEVVKARGEVDKCEKALTNAYEAVERARKVKREAEQRFEELRRCGP